MCTISKGGKWVDTAEECHRLRRENKRLRGWLRHWKTCHCRHGDAPDLVLIGEDCIDDALAGKPAPKVKGNHK